MRLVFKIVGVVAVVAIAAAASLYLSITWNAAIPQHPVGFMEVAVADSRDRPLDIGIWYPSTGTSKTTILGLSAQKLVVNGPVVGRGLPLIVISHGNGGQFASHSDTALALASAGYVVAAVTHTGDNTRDQSYVGTPRWLIDRPRHIRLLVDYMLSGWKAHGQVNGARVGLFGFSAGGLTGLVSIGGVPDYARLSEHCRKTPEFACTLWKKLPSAVPAGAWTSDPRIRAAVIAAPGYGFAFEPNGLSHVGAAVQLWNGTEDRNVPYETNEAVVRRLLPVPPEYHAANGAGHFAFIAPCPSWLFPLICKDADGFDRVSFHRDFNRAVLAFFDARLGKYPASR
jgi:predicted dienelactone hydrolase